MSAASGWRVWLDGARLADARRRLAELAAELLALPPASLPPPPGLMAGLSGMALAHAYLAQAELGAAHEQRCHLDIDLSLDAIASFAGEQSLARGLPGLGFVLEHLGANDDDDQCAALDLAAVEELASNSTVLPEMMWGLAGRLVYARERLSRPSAQTLSKALIRRILALGQRQADESLAWPAEARISGGGYNLGVAHGTPGIVAALAAAADSDDEARAAARDGMRFIWAQRLPTGAAAFPDAPGAAPYATHGWCYGDEGIGAVLFTAADALDDDQWRARWLEILLGASGRAPSITRGITLCHGAAGMAHLWNRMFQTTGEPSFARAAEAWLDATLAALDGGRAPYPGLLDGTAGIALALSGFVSDVEPAWDRLFLLSLRATPE